MNFLQEILVLVLLNNEILQGELESEATGNMTQEPASLFSDSDNIAIVGFL